MNRIPPYLKPGDTIGIAAPARKISRAELAPTLALLERRGYKVVLPDNLFAECHQFAGTDGQRAADMQSLLDNPEVKAIFFARGGYGSVRIIDRLDFTAFLQAPKWLCGYSDMTVFHSHLQANYQIPTLHATMPVNITDETADSDNVRTLFEALEGRQLTYEVTAHPFNRSGSATAPVVGGNLSMLYSLLGSPSDIDTDGKILFIEDLDEYLYHIDRMMMNLKRNGKLERLAGLVIGGMSDMNDNTIPYGKTAEEIVAEHCAGYDYPVCFGFPAGHIARNLTLKLGMTAQLKVADNQMILSFLLQESV